MNKAIVISEFGGPEVLEYVEHPVGEPGRDEIRVRHTRIALNFIDVYHRTGLYPNKLPFVPGVAAVGLVEELGEGVTSTKIGDRITYFQPIGSYTQSRIMPARTAIPVPDNIDDDTAAAVYSKGMTARYLIKDTWAVKPGDTLLFHAAAGGVGQLACSWAKSLGATVIGTVGSEEKVDIARKNGCDHVINLGVEDFVAQVKEITSGRGVDVVYDSIGRDTFERSLACLRPRGLMVSFGNASGPVAVPSLGILATSGSLFLTRPTLAHYFADRKSELAGAKDVFDALAAGKIRAHIGQTYALEDAREAHKALENRQTVGATNLVP